MLKNLFTAKPRETPAPIGSPARPSGPVDPVSAPPAPKPESPPSAVAPLSAPAPGPILRAPEPQPPEPSVTVPAPSSPRLHPAAAQAQKSRDISLYKNLLAGLYDGILIFDIRGSVLASNARAEQFLGYSSQDLWGMHSDALIAGINIRILQKLQANAESGRFTVVNGTCKRKDGTTFPAEIAISRICFLNDGDLIFSIRNIERREKVRDQREMSEEAIRYAGAGIVVCSTEGSIEFVNPAFLKLLNIDNEQAVLKHMIGDFCASYDAVTAMIHAPSRQGLWVGNLELVTPNGLKREVAVTAALSQVRSSGVQRLILTMTPVPRGVATAPQPTPHA